VSTWLHPVQLNVWTNTQLKKILIVVDLGH